MSDPQHAEYGSRLPGPIGPLGGYPPAGPFGPGQPDDRDGLLSGPPGSGEGQPVWSAAGEPDAGRSGPSRGRLVALGVAGFVALAGVLAIGGYGWRVSTQQDPLLETPTALAGLTRDDSERAQTTVDYLISGFAADIELDSTVGAAYTDPAAPERSVLLFGGTTRLWQPETDLDTLFELLSDDTGRITGLREVSAGRLGGVMKCGVARAEDGDLTVCGWADHGSVVMAMFPGRDVSQAAPLLREVRDGVQHRR